MDRATWESMTAQLVAMSREVDDLLARLAAAEAVCEAAEAHCAFVRVTAPSGAYNQASLSDVRGALAAWRATQK